MVRDSISLSQLLYLIVFIKDLYLYINIMKKVAVFCIRKQISKSFSSTKKDFCKILGSLLPIRLHLLYTTMCMNLGNISRISHFHHEHVCVWNFVSLLLSFLLFTLCLHAETQWEEGWEWEKILWEQDSRVWRLIHVCHRET